MLNKIKQQFKKNTEIVALAVLVLIAIISTSYFNFNKNKIHSNYKNILNNVYLKKTVYNFFDNLEPKFKKINHNVSPGETFDSILEQYSVTKSEISEIKKKLSNKINLNKLNVNNNIQFTLDQKNNLVKEFIFKISTTEKIYLTKNNQSDEFKQKILVTKLKKNIVYGESIILESLYKSAISQKIPPNIIVEFARIYGFQVDFQRDIRKKDSFQIMYEIFTDDNKKIIETGKILYSNLVLSGQENSLYYFGKKVVKVIMIKMVKVLRRLL